jgi:hypothetical protein
LTRFPGRLRHLAPRFHRLGLAALLLAVVTGGANAAPFCLPVPGGKPLCIYDDAAACDSRAQQLRQSCSINTDEITMPTQGEAYCSINSERIIQCLYSSFNSCRANIRNDSAFCFPRAATGGGQTEPDRAIVP